MVRIGQLVTAGGTVACAAAIGFFMQITETADRRYGEALAQPDATNTVLELQDITLTVDELAPRADLLPTADARVIKAIAPQVLPDPLGRDAMMPTCDMT